MSRWQTKIWCGKLGKVSETEGSMDRRQKDIVLS